MRAERRGLRPAAGNQHAAVRHARIHHQRQLRHALLPGSPAPGRRPPTRVCRLSRIEMCGRRWIIRRVLQRWCAAHERVHAVHRYLDDALPLATRGRGHRSRRQRPGTQARRGRRRRGNVRAHVFNAVISEPGKPEQRAEHAQNLPARARLAERRHRLVERLEAAFGVHMRAGGFGEWRQRQPDVGILDRA